MYAPRNVRVTRKTTINRRFTVSACGGRETLWIRLMVPLLLCSLFAGCVVVPSVKPAQTTSRADVLDWELPVPAVHTSSGPPHHISALSMGQAESQIISFETNASNHFNSQAEVSIAANPDDPQHVVAATMSLDGPLMILVTRDGGLNWRQVRLPLLGGATNHADPMLTFAADGDVYLTFIPVKNGNQVIGIEATTSNDGGDSWETAQRISSNRQDDKTAIAADRHPDSPYFGNVYLAWKLVRGGIRVSTRSAAASGFSAPAVFSTDAISGLDLAVGGDGTVYLSAANGTQSGITVWRSTNGGKSFGSPRRVAPTRGNAYTRTPSVCTRKALIHSSIAFNNIGPAENGRLHVTWNDYAAGSPQSCDNVCTCESDVFLSSSDDRGLTWSAPVTVGQTAQAGDQYHAWLDVDDRGTVLVAYKDTRDDPVRLKTHTYLSYSTDGGVAWQPDVRVSSASARSDSSFQYGDYQGLSVTSERIYTAWADFRDSSTRSNLYVAQTTLGLPSDFKIDFGVSGAWFEPATTGQGFFMEAIPTSQVLAVAWFTFIPENMSAEPGVPNHRWFTGAGSYVDNVATIDLTLTTGGEFDLETPVENSPAGSVGSVSIEFHSCTEATLVYELFEENLSGVIELKRITANDLCGQVQ